MLYINTDKLEKINFTKNNFYVVIDFDRTLTSNTSDGSWTVFENPKTFNENFVKSAKELYKGEGHGIEKHAGKILIGASALSSVVGVLNTLSSTHRPSRVSASDVIKKDEKYVVN